MREPTLLSSILSARLLRERATAIEALSRRLSPHWRNHLHFALAAAQFGAGRYAAAHRLYGAVDGGPLREEADLMVDWIDYKFGRVAGGWPRYPVARFSPPEHAAVAPGNGPVHVRNFNRPIELIEALGLRPWPPNAPGDLPILVWFNFHDSLGGEILAALVVKAFQRRTGARLILAVDDRHVTTMTENFPGTEVVAKSADLRPIAGRVGGYLLARDVLAEVVRTEADFARVAEQTFFAPPAEAQTGARSRPVLAVAWKTTNRRQARFRNLPIAPLADLLAGIDADFVSAQHGVTPAERAFLSRRLSGRIRFDLIDPSADLATIAGGLTACDGVLTVDNSVLHIAGAYGVPTLGLLALPAYWAWPVSGPGSRWYASVRLLHQQVPGRWNDVLDETRAVLQSWRGGAFA
jgi:hypothetical protein